MRKWILLCLIICVGAFARLYKLGEVPLSLDWDEASLGYNAYTILNTGNDEYGNSLPLSIRSFNDYKPPLYVYLTVPSVALFGLNEFAVRFPSAIAGIVAILFVYLLTFELLKNSKNEKWKHVPIITASIFAIAPWNLQFSRAAFESNVALTFVIVGMYFLIRWFNTQKTWCAIASAVTLAASMYTYHAPRLIVPLLLLLIVIRYKDFFLKNIKATIIAMAIGLIILSPLVIVLVRGSASSRFNSVSIFNPTYAMLSELEYANDDEAKSKWESFFHNRRIIYAKEFILGYLNHYNPVSMFMYGDAVGRHHAPGVGQFYLIELPFIIIGGIALLKNKYKYKTILIAWVALGPLPAAISTGTPHAIRSMLTLPIPYIAIAIGIVTIYNWSKNKIHKSLIIAIISLLYIGNGIYYLNQYYVHQNVEYAQEWQYGYKQLIEELNQIDYKYDKIIVTPALDQPYIYFLFYNYKVYDPKTWVNNGEFNTHLGKYEFRRILYDEDRLLPNTLLVGSPKEIPEGEPGTIDTIKLPENKGDVFRIYDDLKH